MSLRVKEKNLVRSQLQIDLGRNPTDDEVKQALESDRNLSNRVKFAPASTLSLDEPFGEETDQTLGDVLSEEEELSQSYREKMVRFLMTSKLHLAF